MIEFWGYYRINEQAISLEHCFIWSPRPGFVEAHCGARAVRKEINDGGALGIKRCKRCEDGHRRSTVRGVLHARS